MLVSAVVSTYNAQKFIKARLENLLSQTLYCKGLLEIIVIDSGSQEDEASIVREFSLRNENICYLRTEQRETVYGAWNRGISMAQGKYFINANSDDRFSDDALEFLAYALEAQPEVDAAYGDWLYTEVENDRFDSKSIKKLYKYPDFYPPLLFYHQLTSHALMVRCSVFSEVGFFNDKMVVFGDRDWVFRFATAGLKAIHFERVIGLYLKRNDSLERANPKIGNEEYNSLLQCYQKPEYFVKLHFLQEVLEKRKMAQLYAVTGSICIYFVNPGYEVEIVSGLPQQCLIFFRRALAYDPENYMAGNNLAVVAAVKGGIEFAEEQISKLLSTVTQREKRHHLSNNLETVKSGSQNIKDYYWCLEGCRNLIK